MVYLNKTVYELPDDDKMLILTFQCNKCDYRNNDVIPLITRTEPGISELRVTNERDLKSKLYRSPTASLEIPELELEVEPGPRAGFYLTNIEGVLDRFKSAVSTYRHTLEEKDLKKEEIETLLENIDKAAAGNFNFTLRMTDSEGGSYIVPQDESKFSFKKLNQTT
jgi:zinc finger protein